MSSAELCCPAELDVRICLNVSGTRFETYTSTLARFPTTLLGCAEKRSAYYDDITEECYFGRSSMSFEAILIFYQSYGRLKRPRSIPLSIFEDECLFFEIPTRYIEVMKLDEGYITLDEPACRPHGPRWKKIVWEVLREPYSSRVAFVVYCVSTSIVVASIFAVCLETLPSLLRFSSVWRKIDIALAIWFSVEYSIHLYFAPDRLRYMASVLPILDFLSSFPYILFLIMHIDFSLAFLRVFRLARLIRLLKLTSDTKKIELLGHVIKSTLPDIFRLFVCLMMTAILGASLMYTTERDVPGSPFESVPASTWWAVQTVIVLGYGDMVPSTNEGKLLAAVFMVFGVLIFSLPVLSVVSKLSKIYGQDRDEPY